MIRDIMHPATIIDPEMTVSIAAKLMRKKGIGSAIVKNGRTLSIVTERDILNKVVAEDLNPRNTKVNAIMTDLVHTIDSCAAIEDASETFNTCNIRRLPVIEEEEIIGIITSRDVAKRGMFSRFSKKIEYSRLSSGHVR